MGKTSNSATHRSREVTRNRDNKFSSTGYKSHVCTYDNDTGTVFNIYPDGVTFRRR